MGTEVLEPPAKPRTSDGVIGITTDAPSDAFDAAMQSLCRRIRKNFVGSEPTFGKVFGELQETLKTAYGADLEALPQDNRMRALFYLLWAVREQVSAIVTFHGLARSIGSKKEDRMPDVVEPLRPILKAKGIEMSGGRNAVHLTRVAK